MNLKTKIALACGLSASLVVVGSLTPTIIYAVQNAKDEPKVEDDYSYTDADVVDTKTNLLVNYDHYPIPKSDDTRKEINVLEKVAEIESSSQSNKEKVYAFLNIGNLLNINLVNWPLVLHELKNRELSVASQIANKEEFKQLVDLYNSLHKKYAIFEILDRESTILTDSILANHDEQNTPEIAKLRAQNLLKYEIDSAKKTHEQLKGVANFTLNKQTSLNNYYYQSNNRDSFITIDQLNDQGKLFVGSDITPYLSTLAVNKSEIKDTFNLIQDTSYSLNDTQFTLYARIDDFDYEKSEGNFDITIDYGMIETKYDALPNRDDFMVWYSDWKKEVKDDSIFALSDEEEGRNPLKYHMLLSNEIIDEWAREWFADSDHQINFIQDNEHGFDTIRKIVEEKGGLSHQFTIEEISQFVELPNHTMIDNTSLPGVNLEMTISKMDATTNKIDYKLFLTFDFAPDVTIESEEYQDIVAPSKKTIEDLFKTYKNILDTAAVFNDWAYTRSNIWPYKDNSQHILNYAMNILTLCVSITAAMICIYSAKEFLNSVTSRMFPNIWKAILVGIVLISACGLTAVALGVIFDVFNFSNVFKYEDKDYSRNDYWYNIDELLAKMKDVHKDKINDYVCDMLVAIHNYDNEMEKIRNNPNPSMADIDKMKDIFGEYEEPIAMESDDWTLGQKAYQINHWMMDYMKLNSSKYDWMIHTKYGVGSPTHDIIAEVPCAVVANKDALTSKTMFKTFPWLLVLEITTLATGSIILDVALFSEVIRSNFDWSMQFGQLIYDVSWYVWTATQWTCSFTLFFGISDSFDFENMDTNFKKMCSDYASDELFLNVAITVVCAALATISFRFWFTIETERVSFYTVLALFLTLSVYLQVATYFAMFSNFK